MAEWTTEYINDLPDSAFACIEPGGSKDESGRTVPRSLRKYPHHDADGNVDAAHLANARARVRQEGTTSCGSRHLFEAHGLPSDEEASARPPRDYLVRAMPGSYELREELVAGDGRLATLQGHFARFNEWTTIDSKVEGRFRERVAPGAFRKTFVEHRSRMRSLFNHGKDPQIGDKPLGPIEELREDDEGGYYEVALLDTSYNRDLLPGLRAGVYGSSFRFSVVREDVARAKRDAKGNYPTDNPDGLPERTIREAKLYEFGPVTFPAYAGATASVRSMTDEFLFTDLTDNPDRLRELVTYVEPLAPSADAGAEPHLAPERRDQVTATPTQTEKEPNTVELFTIEEKRARYAELNEELTRQAGAYPGVLPDDEQVVWNANVDERDKLGRDIKAWEDRHARLIDPPPGGVDEPVWRPPVVNQINRKAESELHSPETRATTFEGRVAEMRDDAKRILERAAFPTDIADVARTQDKIADLLDHHDSPDGELARRIKYTGSPVYLRAFDKIIKARGSTVGLTPEEQRGTALAVSTDSLGGFTIPFAFDPTVIAIGAWTGAVNPYRRVCRVVPIVGTDTWNALTSTAVVATRTTESTAATEQGPTFAQPQYVVTRVQGQITASFEMFQDRTDLASEMSTLIQEAKDNEEESSMATGATLAANIGVGPVNGTSGAYTSITTATSTTLAAGDADAVEAALPVRHRFGAQWFLNRLSIRRFQALETAGGKLFGGNMYQSVGIPELDRAGNTGLRLLGYPVNESPSLPTAQTANIVIGTLLAPSSYVIVERVGLSVQFIPFILNSSALATGQQALYFLYRNTAHPLNVDAGRTLRYLT